MTRWLVVLSVTVLAGAFARGSSATEAGGGGLYACASRADLVGPCFAMRGRLSFWNGARSACTTLSGDGAGGCRVSDPTRCRSRLARPSRSCRAPIGPSDGSGRPRTFDAGEPRGWRYRRVPRHRRPARVATSGVLLRPRSWPAFRSRGLQRSSGDSVLCGALLGSDLAIAQRNQGIRLARTPEYGLSGAFSC